MVMLLNISQNRVPLRICFWFAMLLSIAVLSGFLAITYVGATERKVFVCRKSTTFSCDLVLSVVRVLEIVFLVISENILTRLFTQLLIPVSYYIFFAKSYSDFWLQILSEKALIFLGDYWLEVSISYTLMLSSWWSLKLSSTNTGFIIL